MRVMDKSMQALATAIKFRQMRQELITSNIANAETPGYKAKRLDFEEALARALDVDGNQSLRVNDPRHYDVGNGGFKNLQPEVSEDPNGIVSENGNTVDRDAEMARINENNLMHDAAVQLLNKKLALRKYILSAER